jgi:Fe2+ or Zn2+ uptake regulation protein
MKNKEELKKAIRAFGEYTPSQWIILDLFLDIEIEHKVHATAKYIAEEMQIKTPTIYFALNLFLKDGLILKDAGVSKAYILSDNKFNYILESYRKKHPYQK